MFDRIKESIAQIVKSRLFVIIIVFVIMFSVLIERVFYLQIVKGQDYLDNYKLQIQKTREISGTRGNIYDVNGNLLAYNELAYSVTFEDNVSTAIPNSERNKILNDTMEQIITIVESNKDSIISSFGIILDSTGNYAFSQSNETQRLRFVADVYGYTTIDKLSDKQRNQSAADIIHYLCTDSAYGYGISESDYDAAHVLKLVTMRYAINLNSFQKFIPTTLASDVSETTVASIMENMDKLTGVDIAEDSLRRYTDSKYFASILGYTGQISQEEYDALDKDKQKEYSLTDIVGKAGLEQTLDEVLQGTKGEETVYVDSVGKVLDTISKTSASAGNDVYLTIDMNLQKTAYDLLEEKLAGILLNHLSDQYNYDPGTAKDQSDIIIPADDAYNAFIGNDILDYRHFSADDAGNVEKTVYGIYQAKLESAINEIVQELQNPQAAAYADLSSEMKAYMSYIVNTVLTANTGILDSDVIDTNDETYQAWTTDESINLYTYLNYAISKNWIDTSTLSSDTSSGKYSDSAEIYQSIIDYLSNYLRLDSSFDKLLYKYLIKSRDISGNQICAMVYEQGVLAMDEDAYNGLVSGSTDSFGWLYGKIESLEITPGQLALEPCTGSVVISDPNTGSVLACVSYPGYDNNRLANTMDSTYYSKLVTGLSRPLYNNATQEKTAPGSTFKMVSAVAGLTEGIIDGSTSFNCNGEFEEVVPSPRCWIYPLGHGYLNVVGAIQNSCNVFFYNVGYNLGITQDGAYSSDQGVQTLAKYAAAFGLGEKSGLEIPESAPQISDSASVPSAIGQGTNNYTVSQLNRYVATVANSGTVYNLSLLDKTTDVDGNVIKDYTPEVINNMDDISDSTWSFVHQGMEGMVSNSSTFKGLDIAMAGKTGTAEQSSLHSNHALFVGYAPADSPEIAIAIRIANGYHSSYAAEIGRDIVRYRFGLADYETLVKGSASELGTAISGD
ncbi:MAG: penicillin-binding transpeptidase domain-containing protein [Hespellia sp.]|nr:penicillin-binding transpeptidase domain-containing protein [Hespellia sp.]